MFDPDVVINELQVQIERVTKSLKKCENLDDRVKMSQVLKNLAETHISYLELMSNLIDTFDGIDPELYEEDN